MTTRDRLTIRLTVNGEAHTVEISSNLMLVDLVRERLNLQGTRVACDQGACGACTVLVDGRPITACLSFAFTADGAAVLTIEGVAGSDNTLDTVQLAFHDSGVPQCGFCTPGMVLLAKAYYMQQPMPEGADVERWLDANICRCSGYQVFRRALHSTPPREDAP
ncbi:MAG: (2Fe-2S)-binding protein [Rhodospirillales bacterium]|jgi:carbon-monoxide dehydrogenase small subunit|nr:(2Fe-2S)-binding protein [Rhodospirillales bacterium]